MLGRRAVVPVPEHPAEVRRVAKAAFVRDRRDRLVRRLEKMPRERQPDIEKGRLRRGAERRAEVPFELAFAVAQEGDESRFLRYADLDELEAPANSQLEFLAFCGVLGLGYLAARGQKQHLSTLRTFSRDARWRIREAVALGLQRYGEEDMLGLIELMESWIEGNHYERRAAVAALCEPGLLREPKWAQRIFDILDRITGSIVEEVNRKADDFKVLRKGLGYGWSVAVAAQPGIGKGVMEKWIGSDDKDVRWIMKQNLKKKRLIRMDEDWAAAQLERLG